MSRALGAGYVFAVLTGDQKLRRDYLEALPTEELLESIDTQIRVMARRIAVQGGRDLAEIAQSQLTVAQMFDELQSELPSDW